MSPCIATPFSITKIYIAPWGYAPDITVWYMIVQPCMVEKSFNFWEHFGETPKNFKKIADLDISDK